MPVKVEKQGAKYRVVEASSGAVALNQAGTPVDGGGFDSQEEAEAQSRAINARKDLREEAVAALQAGLPGVLSAHKPGDATGGSIVLEVALQESAGPFSGITAVPPGVLDLVPQSTLAALRDSSAIFWTPFHVRAARRSSVREAHPLTIAAAGRAVVRPAAGGGYDVMVGSKKVGHHSSQADATKCAAARNRMMRGGLPGEVPEAIVHDLVEWLSSHETRAEHGELLMTGEETTPGDDTPHWHWQAEGATETGIPSDARDDHVHPVDPVTGAIGEAMGHAHPPAMTEVDPAS